jgi:hypothetical protein
VVPLGTTPPLIPFAGVSVKLVALQIAVVVIMLMAAVGVTVY